MAPVSKDDTKHDDEIDWIYRDSTKQMLMRGLYILCAITILAEAVLWLFFGGRETHGPDWGFGFYATLGFVSCSAMIFIAKGLSFVLKKPTDFYDEPEQEEGQ
jgi:hypothetical protein